MATLSMLVVLGLTPVACSRPPAAGTAGGHAEHGGHGHGGHGGHGEGEEEGHGHGHGHGEGNLSLTLFDSGHELFVEIEPLAAGHDSTYTAHVTRLADNRPATSGTLTVRFHRDGTLAAEHTAPSPSRRGIFEFPAGSPAPPGGYELELSYAGNTGQAAWRAAVEVPAEPRPAAETGAAEDLTFTKEQQWDVPFCQEQVTLRKVGASFSVSGTVAADPRNSRAVLAPAAGRFEWSSAFRGKGIGNRVARGEQLGTLWPEVPVEHWSRLEEDVSLTRIALESAKEELARVERLAGRGLPQAKELLAARAAVKKAEVEERQAGKERKRTQKLVDKGLLPGRRLTEAEGALAKARIERKALEEEQERLEELLETRLLQEEGLIAARAALEKAQAAHDAARLRLEEKRGVSERELPLLAPQDGIITELVASHGHHVPLGAPVAHLVSDETVLLEAEVSMFDLETVADIEALWLIPPAPEADAVELGTLQAERVTDSLVFDVHRLTATLTYRVQNDRGFRIGEFVEIQIMLAGEKVLPVIPRSAIVEIHTIPYVFVALSGEGYARRRIVPGRQLGDLVAVESGVADGEWVVTKGGFDLYVSSLTGTLQSHQH